MSVRLLRREASGPEILVHMPKRVLVADDEEMIRELFEAVVRLAGYEPKIEIDGAKALEAAEDPDIALAILDLHMPGMGGIATFQGIKQKRPDLPVMITTGYGAGDTVKKAMSMGAIGFLQKPFPIALAIREIKKALEGAVRPS